jgi:hypothetical protein
MNPRNGTINIKRTNDVSEALRRAPRQHQLKDFKMLVFYRYDAVSKGQRDSNAQQRHL